MLFQPLWKYFGLQTALQGRGRDLSPAQAISGVKSEQFYQDCILNVLCVP